MKTRLTDHGGLIARASTLIESLSDLGLDAAIEVAVLAS